MKSLSSLLGFGSVLPFWNQNHVAAATVSRRAPTSAAEGLEEIVLKGRKKSLTKFGRKEKGVRYMRRKARGLKAANSNIFIRDDRRSEDNTKLGGAPKDILLEDEKSDFSQNDLSLTKEWGEARSAQNKGGAKSAGSATKAKTSDIQESPSGLREGTTSVPSMAKQAKGEMAPATNQTSSLGRIGFLDILFQAGLLTTAALVGAASTAGLLCATGSICGAPSTAPSVVPTITPPTPATGAPTGVPSSNPSAVGSVRISLTSTMSITFYSLLVNDFTLAEYEELVTIMDRFYTDGFQASALATDFVSYTTSATNRVYDPNAAPHVILDFDAISIFNPGSTATNTQVANIMSGLDYTAFVTNYLTQATSCCQLQLFVSTAVFAETTSATNPIIASPSFADEKTPQTGPKETEENAGTSSVIPSSLPWSGPTATPTASPSTAPPTVSPFLPGPVQAMTTGPTAAPSMSTPRIEGANPVLTPAPSSPIPGPSPPPDGNREDSSHNSGNNPSGAPSKSTSSKDDGDRFAFISTGPDDGVEFFKLSAHEEMVSFGTGPDDDKLGSNRYAPTNLPTSTAVPTLSSSTAGPKGDFLRSVSTSFSPTLGPAIETLGRTRSTSVPSLYTSGSSLARENSTSSSTAAPLSRSASNPSSSPQGPAADTPGSSGPTSVPSSSTQGSSLSPENYADHSDQNSALAPPEEEAESTRSKVADHFAFNTGPDNGEESLDFSTEGEMFGWYTGPDDKVGSTKDAPTRLPTSATYSATSNSHSAALTSGSNSEQVQAPSGVSNGLRNLRTRRVRKRTKRAMRHKNIRTNKRGQTATTQRDRHTL